MTFDKFTIKAQEAVQSAVNKAQMAQNQAIEPVHLLAGIMDKGKDVTQFIFQKLGVNPQQIETLVESEIAHLPKVQGGEPYFTNATNEILQKAMAEAARMGDEYVAIEPILMAIMQTQNTAGRILRDAGMTKDEVEKAIAEASSFVESVELFDVYEGLQVGPEKKSMAFTVTFAPKEEEFTTEAVDGYVKKILKNLNNKLGVELRS